MVQYYAMFINKIFKFSITGFKNISLSHKYYLKYALALE
jgi:hypothetical protein